MIIGVLSDTHHNRGAVDQAFRKFQQEGAGAVLFLGDVCSDVQSAGDRYGMEIVCVAGNMDAGGTFPLVSVYETEGTRILMAHGHTLDVRHGPALLLKEGVSRGCQAVLYGHTHIPLLDKKQGILILNPGSAAQPRGGSRASCALLDASAGVVRARFLFLDEAP